MAGRAGGPRQPAFITMNSAELREYCEFLSDQGRWRLPLAPKPGTGDGSRHFARSVAVPIPGPVASMNRCYIVPQHCTFALPRRWDGMDVANRKRSSPFGSAELRARRFAVASPSFDLCAAE